MEKMVYEDYTDEIHSFDSYFGKMTRRGNELIVPFINIGISNHPLNRTPQMHYIDKSYLLFRNVIAVEEHYDLTDGGAAIETFYFGGLDMVRGAHREFKVKCGYVALQLLESSRIAAQVWLPAQMDQEDVRHFLESTPPT